MTNIVVRPFVVASTSLGSRAVTESPEGSAWSIRFNHLNAMHGLRCLAAAVSSESTNDLTLSSEPAEAACTWESSRSTGRGAIHAPLGGDGNPLQLKEAGSLTERSLSSLRSQTLFRPGADEGGHGSQWFSIRDGLAAALFAAAITDYRMSSVAASFAGRHFPVSAKATDLLLNREASASAASGAVAAFDADSYARAILLIRALLSALSKAARASHKVVRAKNSERLALARLADLQRAREESPVSNTLTTQLAFALANAKLAARAVAQAKRHRDNVRRNLDRLIGLMLGFVGPLVAVVASARFNEDVTALGGIPSVPIATRYNPSARPASDIISDSADLLAGLGNHQPKATDFLERVSRAPAKKISSDNTEPNEILSGLWATSPPWRRYAA